MNEPTKPEPASQDAASNLQKVIKSLAGAIPTEGEMLDKALDDLGRVVEQRKAAEARVVELRRWLLEEQSCNFGERVSWYDRIIRKLDALRAKPPSPEVSGLSEQAAAPVGPDKLASVARDVEAYQRGWAAATERASGQLVELAEYFDEMAKAEQAVPPVTQGVVEAYECAASMARSYQGLNPGASADPPHNPSSGGGDGEPWTKPVTAAHALREFEAASQEPHTCSDESAPTVCGACASASVAHEADPEPLTKADILSALDAAIKATGGASQAGVRALAEELRK